MKFFEPGHTADVEAGLEGVEVGVRGQNGSEEAHLLLVSQQGPHPDAHVDISALNELLAFSDYYAVSLYPFLTAYFASTFPTDMFDQIFGLSNKQAVIAETGMIAEDMTAFSINFQSDQAKQNNYMTSLLQAADENDLLFVNWFVLQDYDRFCVFIGGCVGTDRLWRDSGVYDGNGNTRPSYGTWKSYLARPLR